MEIVDIVNENDEVVGKMEKKKADQTGKLHRVIIAELRDSDGNWILVKQASDRQDAGQYVSPVGGHIRSGEKIEDALRREAMEEVGVNDYKSRYIGKKIYYREVIGRKENHFFIVYELTSDQKVKLNHESVGYRKFKTKKLKRLIKEKPEMFGEAFFFVVDNFLAELRD